MAHRDARGSPALAELSGTAALLELARVFKVRDLSSTLVLVSTSGGSAGGAGAHAFAESAAGDPIDAAIVLGDLASKRIHKPWIVPWSNDRDAAPMGLRRTLESAVRREVGAQAGRLARDRPVGAARAAADRLRAGRGGRGGLPAVLLQVSGERGPGPRAAVSENRLDAFGRAAMRAVIALDARASRAPSDDGLFAHEGGGIITVRRLLPDWAIRLLVGTLLLPPLLTAIDAFFGARRRRLPVRALDRLGRRRHRAVPARLAVDPAARAHRRDRRAARRRCCPRRCRWRAGGSRRWFGPARARARRGSGRGARSSSAAAAAGHASRPAGAAAALGLVINVLAAVVWVFNPLAAALLVPAAHALAVRDRAGHVDRRAGARALVADRARAAGADGGPLRARARPRPARPRLARVPDHRGRPHHAARRARALRARRLPVRAWSRSCARAGASSATTSPSRSAPAARSATPGRARWAEPSRR